MENNFQPADLAVIANALEYYRDYMMQDIELSADHPNIARYFRRCAEDANKVLQSVRAELGLPEKPWKYADVVAQTAQEIEGSCDGCMHIDCERDERPCSECGRLDRVDRYEEEDPTLADVFPELHGGKDADHET